MNFIFLLVSDYENVDVVLLFMTKVLFLVIKPWNFCNLLRQL